MIYGSVCSGIEAASVAWHPLGWRPAWFAEVAPFPSAVLAHHYPRVTNHGDFTTIRDRTPIDLLVGGTPCQAFSVAGLRGGLSDERGNLALEYCRLADALRPRWVVWENVPGVLSSGGGRDFGSILGALAEIGYGFAYRVLDAQFYGVPQRRRRIFLVGYLGDWRRAAAVLFEPASLRGDSEPRRTPRSDAARGAAVGVGGSVAHTLRGVESDASEDGTGRGTPVIAIQAATRGRNRREYGIGISEPGAPSYTWDTRSDRAICFDTTQITSKTNRSNPRGGDPCHPLAAQARPPTIARTITAHHGRNSGEDNFVSSPDYRVRRLTPRECERLQGFPDDYTAIPGAKDGPRYHALGNSMAVPIMRWIGKRIRRVEAIS